MPASDPPRSALEPLEVDWVKLFFFGFWVGAFFPPTGSEQNRLWFLGAGFGPLQISTSAFHVHGAPLSGPKPAPINQLCILPPKVGGLKVSNLASATVVISGGVTTQEGG